MIGSSVLGRKLTAEWNRPGVRCVNYFVVWQVVVGTPLTNTGYQSVTGLYYRKGRKASVNRKPVIRRKRR